MRGKQPVAALAVAPSTKVTIARAAAQPTLTSGGSPYAWSPVRSSPCKIIGCRIVPKPFLETPIRINLSRRSPDGFGW
ncbi:hypothetical protein [Dactylosporangium sp. NPDC049140]|uniref:hypothetical protein n=1 Tax=Dactylosporangium sp. NPDC049140 TaxID=3155647 RepID=UPI0033FC409E